MCAHAQPPPTRTLTHFYTQCGVVSLLEMYWDHPSLASLFLPARPSIDWWPLASTHCTLPASSKTLWIHNSPFVMPPPHSPTSLPCVRRLMNTISLSLISPSLSLVFLGSYRSLWCNCASLHHAAFPQFLHTGGLHFTQENSLPFWLSQLWMLAIIPHRHNIRPVEKGWGVACAHMSKKLED